MTAQTMEHTNHMISVFMPISRWQESLLFLVLLTSCSVQSTYYVTPTPDTPCPGEPCHTLSQYVADQYFNNLPVYMYMTMEFLPGNHTLEQIISVTKLAQLTLRGDSSSLPEITTRIVCTWPAGFVFTGITEVYISSLAFISCGHNDRAVVNIISVQQSKISNCSFHNNVNRNHESDHGGGALYIQTSLVVLVLNKFQHNSATIGGAIYMDDSSSTIIGNTFEYNSADLYGGALHVQRSNLTLIRSSFRNNSAQYGGALTILYSALIFTWNTFQYNYGESRGGAVFVFHSTLSLTRSTFHNNSAQDGGALSVLSRSILNFTSWNTFQNNSAIKFGGALTVVLSTLYFTERNIIGNNTAQYGGGIAAVDSQLELAGNTSFDSNTATYGGGLYVHNTEISGNMTFIYGSATEGGGGVYASQSTFNFTGESTIKNNSAEDGGGLLFSGQSKFYLQSNAHVHFINNSAKHNGGAIKVEESTTLTYCIHQKLNCFFQIQAPFEHCSAAVECAQYINNLNVSITFDNNIAMAAGADLHGGSVDNCVFFSNIETACIDYHFNCPTSGQVFNNITSGETTPDVSSDPLYICTCGGNQTDCTGSYHHPEPVYPGGTLEVPVIAHGQRNGTTPAVIQLISTYNSSVTFEKPEDVQNADNKCTALTYTIHSYEKNTIQEMTLYAKGPCLPTDTLSNTLRVLIDISHCPPGFQISKVHPKCVCAERLQKVTTTCLVDDKKILRAHDAWFWVGYDSTSHGLILHPHCPFDYCIVKEIYLAVDDSDKQCNYNRSGLLCGTCSDNLSLALGSSRCLQCSNSYLALLAAFAFAGIALVFLLLVLRLTVAAGTINGLIFYANIVAVNSATFFQPRTTNILIVFIAWLNLDLGIDSCFYNGMDAYVKTWLQFAFPLYVWALVGMIIIGSHYLGRVAKVFGRNPVAVLATLFLLSYAKLLRTVIAALSYTYLEYPNDSQIAVWLYDGNIRYLSGKHAPLFTAGIVCLIFLFFPYTMLLLFSQCVQAKSEVKIFSCINSHYVTPFLDAYHAPYSNKHRYWTGLILLLRFILFLISAVNALGDPSVNLLAIGSITTLVLPTIFGFRIYKTWSLGLLETSFILNLTILVVATLYIRLTGGNQNAATFTSVGIAFATFTGIVIYHSVQQIKGTKLWRRVYLRHDYPPANVTLEPGTVFEPGSTPTQTVVKVCYHELRESCMETA